MAAAGNISFAPCDQLFEGSLEPNVDVYCLAATLYYIVTGRCPEPSVNRKFYRAPLVEPKQIQTQISDRTNRAILKGMAIEPRDRPQTMQDWIRFLESSPDSPSNPVFFQLGGVPWGEIFMIMLFYAARGGTLAEASASFEHWAIVLAGVGMLTYAIGDNPKSANQLFVWIWVASVFFPLLTLPFIGWNAILGVVCAILGGGIALTSADTLLKLSFSRQKTVWMIIAVSYVGLLLGFLLELR
jgi:hypothetical protein